MIFGLWQRPVWQGLGLSLALLSAPVMAQDDGLREALQATIKNHPAVAGKQAEVEASESGLSAARSQWLPNFSAQASHYTSSDRSNNGTDDLSNPATLRLRQPLLTFGRIGNDVDVAQAQVSVEESDFLRVRRDLLTETALAYVDVLAARARSEVAASNLGQLFELQGQIQRRAAGGLASDADARLAAARLSRARVSEARFQGELSVALNVLHSLTREPVNASEEIPEAFLQLPPARQYERKVLDNSAELQRGEWNVKRAEAESKQAITSSMPTVYLQAEKFYDQPGLRDDNQVSIVIEGNLEGLGFGTRYRSQAASSRKEAARQDLLVTRMELIRDARRLRQLHDLQLEIETSHQASVLELQLLIDSYQRQYESGSKSWLDVLNIQQELNDQRLELVRTESDRIRYALELQAMSGELDHLIKPELTDD